MDTLLLKQKIKTIGRDKLYFDLYEYCVHFKMQEVTAIKLSSHAKIDEYLNLQQWRRKINHGGSWRWQTFGHPITETSIKNCHTAHNCLKTIAEDYKLITSYDYGYLYLKDLEGAVNFLDSPGITVKVVNKVVLDRPKDSMIIKSAKHHFRTYFKNQKIEIEEKQNLISFLRDRPDIRLSPGMQEWISKYSNHKYVCDNYFIDHNDDGFLTLLCLVSSIKIKKTVTLLTE